MSQKLVSQTATNEKKNFPPVKEELRFGSRIDSLIDRMAVYRIKLHVGDEGVALGYKREDRWIRSLSKERRAELYRGAKAEYVPERKLAEIRGREEEKRVSWAHYDDEKESGMKKAIRAILKHVVEETYQIELIELSKFISYVRGANITLSEIARKGDVLSKEDMEIIKQTILGIKLELKGKRNLFKRVAQDAVSSAMEIVIRHMDKKDLPFWINTVPGYLHRIWVALEKRRESIPNISTYQLRKLDALCDIQSLEISMDSRNANSISSIIKTINFVMDDIERRKRMMDIIACSAKVIEMNGTGYTRWNSLSDEISNIAKGCKTSVVKLQGVKPSLEQAAKDVAEGKVKSSLGNLNSAIKMLEARIKDVKKKIAEDRAMERLEKIKDKIFHAVVSKRQEDLLGARGQRRSNAAMQIDLATGAIELEEFEKAVGYLENASRTLVKR